MRMKMNWNEQFEPLKSSLGLSVRKEQQILADEIIDVMDNPVGTQHICAEAGTGTGKSFAYLIPLIHKVRGTDFRGVVSTETITLQDQVAYKDLPLLSKVYPGFTFMSLKGRSNYLCFARANVEASSHPEIIPFIDMAEKKRGQYVEGTQDELNRLFSEKIPDDAWRYMCGESDFCQDCDESNGDCYGSMARAKAPNHDIVVTNHALLQADAVSESAILGEHQFLIIDEAHTLEDVFINSLGEEISGYDIYKHKKAIEAGCSTAASILMEPDLGGTAIHVSRTLDHIMDAIIDFYSLLDPGPWDKAEGILRERTVFGNSNGQLLEAMEVMEKKVPDEIDSLIVLSTTLQKKLVSAKDTLREIGGGKKKGLRDITKAITSLKTISKIVKMIKDTVSSRDGIVKEFGVPYVVEYNGYVDKENRKRVNLGFVPIDVSKDMMEGLWRFDPTKGVAEKTCIILSATLTDITDGSFRFAKASVGFPAAGVRELTVLSPFDYDEQQLVYTTPGTHELVPVERAQYSLDEAVELIQAAGGRSLLLFTAKAELEYAAENIRTMGLPYSIFVQGEGMNKRELAEAFMADESSVLLATKSFFTGVNFSGEACSMVIMCKFPLKRFTDVCKAQIQHWKMRGFPSWYEMQALTVFRQAAGRLIRSETDRGVVAIIDKRVSSPKERVFSTASMGVSTLGSVVTNDINDIKEFFS